MIDDTADAGGASPPDGAAALPGLAALYEQMLVIRCAEEQLVTLFADGAVPGFIHLSIGQEAISAGVAGQLRRSDTVASTHRGHGHAIAKGLPLDGFFAELLGREEGLCRGRGGSMHVADLSVGMLGANGIVAAGVPIALGSALAHKTRGRDAIAVAFFGDGALAEGVVHESMNMASLLRLPVLFVCENNGWSEFSPTDRQIAFKLEALCGAYGIEYRCVDGNDVAAVHAAAGELIAGIRNGPPAVLECRTHRVRGHYEGDAQKYRDAAEIVALPEYDPIRVTGEQLLAGGVAPAVLEAAAQRAGERIAAAVTAAKVGAEPAFDAALRDVYTA